MTDVGVGGDATAGKGSTVSAANQLIDSTKHNVSPGAPATGYTHDPYSTVQPIQEPASSVLTGHATDSTASLDGVYRQGLGTRFANLKTRLNGVAQRFLTRLAMRSDSLISRVAAGLLVVVASAGPLAESAHAQGSPLSVSPGLQPGTPDKSGKKLVLQLFQRATDRVARGKTATKTPSKLTSRALVPAWYRVKRVLGKDARMRYVPDSTVYSYSRTWKKQGDAATGLKPGAPRRFPITLPPDAEVLEFGDFDSIPHPHTAEFTATDGVLVIPQDGSAPWGCKLTMINSWPDRDGDAFHKGLHWEAAGPDVESGKVPQRAYSDVVHCQARGGEIYESRSVYIYAAHTKKDTKGGRREVPGRVYVRYSGWGKRGPDTRQHNVVAAWDIHPETQEMIFQGIYPADSGAQIIKDMGDFQLDGGKPAADGTIETNAHKPGWNGENCTSEQMDNNWDIPKVSPTNLSKRGLEQFVHHTLLSGELSGNAQRFDPRKTVVIHDKGLKEDRLYLLHDPSNSTKKKRINGLFKGPEIFRFADNGDLEIIAPITPKRRSGKRNGNVLNGKAVSEMIRDFRERSKGDLAAIQNCVEGLSIICRAIPSLPPSVKPKKHSKTPRAEVAAKSHVGKERAQMIALIGSEEDDD